jgi:hypothetical protein
MDTQHLRMIANPYLIRKNKEKHRGKDVKLIENNDLLYRYLELKYKDIYINPKLFYEIIKKIEKSMEEYQVEMTLKFIVDSVIIDNIDNM